MKAQAAHLLSEVLEEMLSYQSERSENWMESERAEAFQELLNEVQQAHDFVQEIL